MPEHSDWRATPELSRGIADGATPSRASPFEEAARFARPLAQGAAAAAAVSVAAFATQQILGLDLLVPLAIYALLSTTVLALAARMARLRSAVHESGDRVRSSQERQRHTEQRVEALLGQAGLERFQPDGSRQATPAAEMITAARARLVRFAHHGIAIAFVLVGNAGLLASLVAFLGGLDVAGTGPPAVVVGLSLGALAFALSVAARACAAIPPERWPESAGLAEWLRGGQWLSLLSAVVMLISSVIVFSPEWSRWPALAFLALSASCAIEILLRGVWLFLRPPPSWEHCELPAHSLTLATLFHGRSPFHGVADLAERHLGLSLHTAWAVEVARRSMVPLIAGFVLLVWASTALVAVQPEEQGVRLRFGRLASPAPIDPGLHLKLPWPLETIDRYPVRRVQTLDLGYSGAAKDVLLWGRVHSGVEYQLLLGDGRELVSVDATVSYRIRDVVAFALAFQNPRDALDALAYQLLLRATVSTNLDRLLTADRAPFARRFAADLQQICDGHGLGVEILHASFVSLHPPVGIAQAYEDVVSAEIERVTRVARAQAERAAALPAAQAEALRATRRAEADAARRLADARSAASRFLGVVASASTAPDLFRFRQRLEAIENALRDRSLFVVDRRLRTETGNVWIDLRPRGADALPMEKR